MMVTYRMKKLLLLFLSISIAALAATLSGCVLPDYAAFLKTDAQGNAQTPSASQTMITTSSDPIVLEWDPPATTVSKYGVYFRVHGQADWTKLGEAPADPHPSYSVYKASIGLGEFDFAVDSIGTGGDASAFHTSLDATANPGSGWYVKWQ
jgi:hypothetical protein